jgi:hypothetical protein
LNGVAGHASGSFRALGDAGGVPYTNSSSPARASIPSSIASFAPSSLASPARAFAPGLSNPLVSLAPSRLGGDGDRSASAITIVGARTTLSGVPRAAYPRRFLPIIIPRALDPGPSSSSRAVPGVAGGIRSGVVVAAAIFAIFASRRVGVCVTARSSVRRIVSSRVSSRARRRSIDRVGIKIDSTTILDPTNSSPSRARVDANRREPRASLDASKYVSLDAARTRVESSRDASRVDDCVRTR